MASEDVSSHLDNFTVSSDLQKFFETYDGISSEVWRFEIAWHCKVGQSKSHVSNEASKK